MKPDWKDAPEWANWLAMDEDGQWAWFENRPRLRTGGVWLTDDGRITNAGRGENWQESLEERHKSHEC